jgi:hypothetical protein
MITRWLVDRFVDPELAWFVLGLSLQIFACLSVWLAFFR